MVILHVVGAMDDDRATEAVQELCLIMRMIPGSAVGIGLEFVPRTSISMYRYDGSRA